MGNRRKIRLILAAFMACSLCHFAHPVHATMERDGATWWSVEELIEVYKEAEAERETICGETLNNCYAEQYFRMVGQEPKYKALERLLSMQLSITSINPTKETIKVFFYDKPMTWLMSGIKDNTTLGSLHLYWSENTYEGAARSRAALTDGEKEQKHEVYNEKTEKKGENLFSPREEVELSMSAGANLVDNKSGILRIEAAGASYGATGTRDYSGCLNSSDYREGMECKLYSSQSKGLAYFPHSEVTEPEAPATSETNPEEPSPSEEATVGEENNIIESTSDSKKDRSESTPEDRQLATIKAPETGGNNNVAKYNPELITWFVMLMIFGVLLVIWWFIPTRTEKSRKKYKKCRKSIDKSGDLR